MIRLQYDLSTALAIRKKGEELGDDWYKYQPTEKIEGRKVVVGTSSRLAANRKKSKEGSLVVVGTSTGRLSNKLREERFRH